MSETITQNNASGSGASKTITLVFIAMMTAVICVLGPFAINIPVSPVPISLATLALYTIIYILGWKKGTTSCVLYLLIGLAGAPVFTNFSGGVGKLFGPTGGYLIGYIPMMIIIGLFVQKFDKKWLQFFGFILGTAILYLFGTLWLAKVANMKFMAALAAGVIPYIPGDLVKIIIAMILGPMVKKQLNKANLIISE